MLPLHDFKTPLFYRHLLLDWQLLLHRACSFTCSSSLSVLQPSPLLQLHPAAGWPLYDPVPATILYDISPVWALSPDTTCGVGVYLPVMIATDVM